MHHGEKYYSVQILRGAAAIMVVVHHASIQLYGKVPGAVEFLWPSSGVDLFFLISGFVMVVSTASRPVGPAQFLLDRATRVVPLYWLATLAMLFVLALSGQSVPLINIAKSLFFIPHNNILGALAPVLFVGWTLNYEALFYVFFAATLAFGGRIQFLFLTFVFLAMVASKDYLQDIDPAFQAWTSPLLVEFLVGMSIAFLRRWLAALPITAGSVFVIAGVTALLALAWTGAASHRVIIYGLPMSLLLAGFISLERHIRFDKWSLGQLLGAASYSIYLVHPFVVIALPLSIARADLYLYYLAAFFISIVAGICLYQYLESPLTRTVKGMHRTTRAA